MSGHSKWHNIRVKKTATDKARGKIYTRHAKLIQIAAQKGGDPDMNPSLRVAIDNAKADNVPNANIDRAIAKGTGESKGAAMEEVMYAAYGPGNVAILIECLTDNKNRALTNVKMNVSKNGGNFAETGSVAWMFARKGIVTAKRLATSDQRSVEEMELELIDFGAEDISAEDDILSVTTDLQNWPKVRDFLKSNGYEILSAGLQYVASQKTELKDQETINQLTKLIDALEEDDDVSEVHTNAETA